MGEELKNDRVLYFHKIPNGRVFYVGIGNKYRPYTKSGRTKWWKNIVNKHGYDVEIVLENLSKAEAVERECYYIKHFGRADIGLGNLVNMTDGGDGNHNRKHSQETKDKISKNSAKIWLGKQLPLETRVKLSKSHIGLQVGENHPLFGKYHSQETKDKIGESNKGKKHSKKTLKKMSKAKLGKIKTKEHRKNLSKSLLGKIKSEEHKKKLSESHKGKKLTKEHKSKISKSLKGRKCSIKTSDEISKKAKEKNIAKGIKTSKYKGINWCKGRDKWKASVFMKGKTRFIGYFDDEEKAFKEYNEFVKTFLNENHK